MSQQRPSRFPLWLLPWGPTPGGSCRTVCGPGNRGPVSPPLGPGIRPSAAWTGFRPAGEEPEATRRLPLSRHPEAWSPHGTRGQWTAGLSQETRHPGSQAVTHTPPARPPSTWAHAAWRGEAGGCERQRTNESGRQSGHSGLVAQQSRARGTWVDGP